MLAASASAPWMYPQLPPRIVGRFDETMGVGLLLAGLFTLGMCVLFLPFSPIEPVRAKNLVPLGLFALLGISLVWGGVQSIRVQQKNKQDALRLQRVGVPCWGRVVTSRLGRVARKVGFQRWLEVHLEVDAFVAPGASGAPGVAVPPPGSLLASRVKVHWFVCDAQMFFVQPGGFCALLVDPAPPHTVYLDGFATAEGHFVATI
ncbi:hypothetical protein [Polyangium sp. 6x1]|uniref:hypothetical protein n=1 Tax=Polyangium sp. 6x1 TaxID=3042689 RepID=UPI0024821856|nr:hypothetical protein [Polyangium sp. 6x1]MDI1452113.1 hypothetical protein [Polyangium sp. 6x1]